MAKKKVSGDSAAEEKKVAPKKPVKLEGVRVLRMAKGKSLRVRGVEGDLSLSADHPTKVDVDKLPLDSKYILRDALKRERLLVIK